MEFVLPARQLFSTSRGYHYSYIHITNAPNKKTLLLIHGFPSHIDDWVHQIRYFGSKGYGLLVPDMLGYGDSSVPAETEAYRLKLISQDLAELLDHVKLEQVVGVGHDWGATILSRLAMYHPGRFAALAFLGIGASKPGTAFDLDGVNRIAKEATGSEMLGYITYISRDPDAAHAMERHADSVMDVMFAADPHSWDRHLRPCGAFKSFVEGGSRQPVGEWFTKELCKRHLETFARPSGYLGASCYYRMLDLNLSVPDEAQHTSFVIERPAVLILSKQDVAASQMQEQMLSAWSSSLSVVLVDSGHWVHLERSNETNQAIETLLS